MPLTDDRLRDAIHAAAREPTLDGVTERVRAKRARRQVVRRIELGAVAAVVILGVTVAGFALLDSGDPRDVAVGPAPTVRPLVRVAAGAAGAAGVDAGRRASVSPVRVTPDEGYLRGPILGTDRTVALAAYDRAGDTFSFPPSRIVRIRADGSVLDRIDLQGEVLALADGEGARWALTEDKTVLGPQDPRFRVKRIGPDQGVASNPVPPTELVTGSITAGGGGVWVPVRDGVLRFDPVTGAFASKVALSTATDRRAVAVIGKAAYVTDGTSLLRLDPSSSTFAGSIDLASRSIESLVDLTSDQGGAWALARATPTAGVTVRRIGADGTLSSTVALSAAARPVAIHANNHVVWVDATLAGRRVTLLLQADGQRVERTLGLGKAADATVTLLAPQDALLTSDGALFRVRLPR